MAKRNGKHLFFRPPEEDSLAQLDEFMKLAVVRGAHWTVILDELIRKYNTEFREKMGLGDRTLSFEHELISSLRSNCVKISRTRLGHHRDRGNLDGKHWADGVRVVYDAEGCKAFFALRRAA